MFSQLSNKYARYIQHRTGYKSTPQLFSRCLKFVQLVCGLDIIDDDAILAAASLEVFHEKGFSSYLKTLES